MSKFLTSDPVVHLTSDPVVHPLNRSHPMYWDFEVVRFNGMLRGIGIYELVNNHGIYENYLTV